MRRMQSAGIGIYNADDRPGHVYDILLPETFYGQSLSSGTSSAVISTNASSIRLRWFGDNVYGHTGYANNVRELIYAMHELGADAKAVYLKPPEGVYIPPKCAGLVEHDTTTIDKDTHVSGRTYVYDNCLRPFVGKAKSISAIMVLEGDRLPQDWVAVSNTLDFLWTASEYGKKQFIANGVVPELIRVIPHGVDPNVFYPNRHVKKPHIIEDDFVFLFVGGFAIPGDRKGCDMLAYAFSQEFKQHEKATLILKINPTYGWQDMGSGARGPGEYLAALTKGNPKVRVMTEQTTQAKLAEIYNVSDVHVMPSLGEAFSMNLAESMACGKTVITTNWAGPLDFCKPKFSYLVDVERFVRAHYGEWDVCAGSRWALPSLKHLQEFMRYAFDNQDEVRKKGRMAQRHILDNFLWRHAAEKTIRALKELE